MTIEGHYTICVEWPFHLMHSIFQIGGYKVIRDPNDFISTAKEVYWLMNINDEQNWLDRKILPLVTDRNTELHCKSAGTAASVLGTTGTPCCAES